MNSSGIDPSSIPPSNPAIVQSKTGCRISEIGRKILLGLFMTATAGAALSLGAFIVLGASLLLTAALVFTAASAALGLGLLYPRVIPHLPPILQKIAYQIHSSVMEIFAFLAAASTYFIDLTKSNPDLSSPSKEPILLVHGYLHNSSAWIYFKKRLVEQNIGPVWTVNLGHPFDSIENYAAKITNLVQEIHQKTHLPVRLVGHSMGGLVSLQASCDLGKQVKQVITLGTPLDGTYLGKIGLGKCARQMQYDSPFIQGLRKKLDGHDVNRYHIYSKADGIVLPFSSGAFSKDPQGWQKDNRFPFLDIGHISLVYSDAVIDQTIEILKLAESPS